jgi:hypothetical protein
VHWKWWQWWRILGVLHGVHGGHETMGVGDARVSLWVLWTLGREDVEVGVPKPMKRFCHTDDQDEMYCAED